MNKFIEKIVVPKSFLTTRDCAPVVGGLVEDPVLE